MTTMINTNPLTIRRRVPEPNFEPVLSRLKRWWIRHRVENALSQLSDATLRDIGVLRGQIPEHARNLAESLTRRTDAAITDATAVSAGPANRSTGRPARSNAAA